MSTSMNDTTQPSEVDAEMTKLNEQLKFWPESERSYLNGLNFDINAVEGKDRRKHLNQLYIDLDTLHRLGLSYDGLGSVEEIEDEDAPGAMKKVLKFKLLHPGWSKMPYNMAEDLDTDLTPLMMNTYDDNSSATQKFTQINENGNGVCPLTAHVYCKFFEMFDFTKHKNQELIYRIYTEESCLGYKFTPNDWSLEDVKKFTDYFEAFSLKDGGDFTLKNYKNAQLMQSLLILSDFMECKILLYFAVGRMAHYLNVQIDYFVSQRSNPEKLRSRLAPDTDMSWIKDEDDLIANVISQWLGVPSPQTRWTNLPPKDDGTKYTYDDYKEHKENISWLKTEGLSAETADWDEIFKNSKAKGVDPNHLYIVPETYKYPDYKTQIIEYVKKLVDCQETESVEYLAQKTQNLTLKQQPSSAEAAPADDKMDVDDEPESSSSGDDDDN